MRRMHRAAGILPILILLLLAACAAPGTGGGGTETTAPESSAAAAASASESASASEDGSANGDGEENGAVERIDIGVLASDLAAVEGQEVAVLARVNEVLVDGVAFMTSPSGTEDDQFPVVLTADAEVNKEIAAGSNLWLEGTTVAFDADALEGAGVDLPFDQLGAFDGEFVFVASSVEDPLERGDD